MSDATLHVNWRRMTWDEVDPGLSPRYETRELTNVITTGRSGIDELGADALAIHLQYVPYPSTLQPPNQVRHTLSEPHILTESQQMILIATVPAFEYVKLLFGYFHGSSHFLPLSPSHFLSLCPCLSSPSSRCQT